MSNTIRVNSVRLESLLTKKFKTDRKKTISRALGFKDNALGEALKRGTLSVKMVEALDRLNIDRRDYEEISLVKKDTSTSESRERDTAQTGADNDNTPTQLSIDDLETIKRDELKNLIKEVIVELFDEMDIRSIYNPIEQETVFYFRKKEGKK